MNLLFNDKTFFSNPELFMLYLRKSPNFCSITSVHYHYIDQVTVMFLTIDKMLSKCITVLCYPSKILEWDTHFPSFLWMCPIKQTGSISFTKTKSAEFVMFLATKWNLKCIVMLWCRRTYLATVYLLSFIPMKMSNKTNRQYNFQEISWACNVFSTG